mmetsp:Transcript_21953/g.59186  ORF Transcript_21953/g.59186 Transcript_21953/m.59186 type:complete len:228 (+) Transcript_21953:340-1023(+)
MPRDGRRDAPNCGPRGGSRESSPRARRERIGMASRKKRWWGWRGRVPGAGRAPVREAAATAPPHAQEPDGDHRHHFHVLSVPPECPPGGDGHDCLKRFDKAHAPQHHQAARPREVDGDVGKERGAVERGVLAQAPRPHARLAPVTQCESRGVRGEGARERFIAVRRVVEHKPIRGCSVGQRPLQAGHPGPACGAAGSWARRCSHSAGGGRCARAPHRALPWLRFSAC